MRKRGRNRQFVLAVNGRSAVKTVFLLIVSLLLVFILSGVLTSLRPELRPSSSLYRVTDELGARPLGSFWEWKTTTLHQNCRSRISALSFPPRSEAGDQH